MTKKIKASQILRHSIQLILFVLLPGLYAMAFSELKTVYKMIISGNFNFLQAFPSLVEFTAIMLLTIALGRWFCGWICAFGAYNDLIYFISKKVFKTKFKVNEEIDSILKYVKYIVLIFIIIVSWTMGSNMLESTSPWDVFGQITNVSTIFSTLLIGFILLVLITIGAFFIERFFCRYLCPLGAVFAIISRIGITKINKPKADCGKCKACTINCSMGLKLYKVNGAKGGDCINCLKCTEVCPRNNAKVNILGQDLNQNIAGSVAMAAMLGVYGFTNFGADALTKSGMISNDSTSSSDATLDSSASDDTSQKYKDGTYTGSGTGFGGITKISVTIANGKISDIETLSNGDDPEYFKRASGIITKDILSKQSTEVDTVSGATYSSKGIISAVKDALNQASGSASDSDTSSNSSGTKEEAITSNSIDNSKGATSDATVSPKSTTSDPTANQGSTSSNSSSATSNNSSATKNATTTSNPVVPPKTTNSASAAATPVTPAPVATSKGQYKDGTYTGTGSGYGGTTKISVTVSNGKITGIQTLSNEDTSQYYNRAIGTIKNSIISKQSASVNTVSGATHSSNGIIQAVQNALSQAS